MWTYLFDANGVPKRRREDEQAEQLGGLRIYNNPLGHGLRKLLRLLNRCQNRICEKQVKLVSKEKPPEVEYCRILTGSN